MKKECMGIINLNKKGEPINKLSDGRLIGSIPIGGRYRIVDFVLSNMVNAGISDVGVFSDQKYRSLTDHLGGGQYWDLDRRNGGLFVFSPENTKDDKHYSFKKGDIYNIFSNIDCIEKSKKKYVLISSSYMICNVDYKKAFKYHKESGNDVTLIYKKIDNANEDFEDCLTLNINKENKVSGLGSNLGINKEENIYMEMFVMERTKFIDMMYKAISKREYAYISDAINNYCDDIVIGAYAFDGYLKCINSVKTYFEANKDFLNLDIAKELFYSDRKILTKEKKEQPTLYKEGADVKNSFVATGCTIEGTVKDSIIFRKVHIKKGTTIENCIIMQGGNIEENVNLKNVILDKQVTISKDKDIRGDIQLPIIIEKNTNI